MSLPNAEQLHEIVSNGIGDRGGDGTQEPTAAIGFLKSQVGLYFAKQGGVVSQSVMDKVKAEWTKGKFETRDYLDADNHIQARWLAQSQRKVSEWTGYHAEMVIISAMLSANGKSLPITVADTVTMLKSCGGAVICANAKACWHCASMMTALNIEYHGGKGKKSLTAWWNPLTDERFASSSVQFGADIPGSK